MIPVRRKREVDFCELRITCVAFWTGLRVPDLEAILGGETPPNSFQLNPP